MRSRSAYGDGPRGFSARSINSASASSKPSASPPPASSTTRRAGSELSPGGSSSSSRPGSAPMCAASAAASSSCRRSNSLSDSMRGSYRIARAGQTGAARLAPSMARGLIPLPTPDERAAIVRAKARLDRLSLYPRPVDVGRVRILHTPWLFALPWFRRFDGYEAGPLIFLRHPLSQTFDDLIVHELCHVWQSQHRMIRMAP